MIKVVEVNKFGEIRGAKIIPFPAMTIQKTFVPLPAHISELEDIFTLEVMDDSLLSPVLAKSILAGTVLICAGLEKVNRINPHALYAVGLSNGDLLPRKVTPNTDGTMTLVTNNCAYEPITCGTADAKIFAIIVGRWLECPQWKLGI